MRTINAVPKRDELMGILCPASCFISLEIDSLLKIKIMYVCIYLSLYVSKSVSQSQRYPHQIHNSLRFFSCFAFCKLWIKQQYKKSYTVRTSKSWQKKASKLANWVKLNKNKSGVLIIHEPTQTSTPNKPTNQPTNQTKPKQQTNQSMSEYTKAIKIVELKTQSS